MIPSGRARTTIIEVDLSERVPSFPGLYVGTALKTNKGEFKPVLITSDTDYLRRYTVYEKVSPGDDLAHYCNLAVLEKCNKLWVSRAEDGSLYGGCILNQDKPYNTVGVTFNDGLFTVNLRNVTTEELVAAEIMWKSISTGDVFTFSAENSDTLPNGLTLGVKYYLIPYQEETFSYRLATSYANASAGVYIEFSGTGGSAILLNFGNDKPNAEIATGFTDPDTYQLDTSDGKMAGLNSTFTVDTGNSQVTVSKQFWTCCVTGTELVIAGNAADMPVSTPTLYPDTIVYAIVIPQTGVNKDKYKLQLASSASDAAKGSFIPFSSVAGATFTLKLNSLTNITAITATELDFVNDTLTTSTSFYQLCAKNDRCKLSISASGTYPTVAGAAPLSEDNIYYVIKGVNNLIQLSTSKDGVAINFTGTLAVSDTLTVTLLDKVDTSNGKVDLSKDTLTITDTLYENIETGYSCTVSSTGTLPTGLTSSATYYMIKTKTANKIMLASTAVNAELGIPVDILDAGILDLELGQSHLLQDTHNTQYTGFNQGCMLFYNKTRTGENIYITSQHYPYGTSDTWTADEKVLARTLGVANSFKVSVFKKLEDGTFDNVENWLMSRHQDAVDDSQVSIYCDDVVKRSNYIGVINNTNVNENIYPANQTTLLKLANGSNGSAVTTGAMILAIQKLANVRRYTCNVIIDGGYTVAAYQQAIISLCESRQFSIGLLSSRLSDELSSNAMQDVIDYRNEVLMANTSYAAMYSPHLKIYDKFNNREIYVAPVGHVAANMSHTAEYQEAWYPVAGNTRGVLNVLGLSKVWEEGEEDELYNNSINPISFSLTKGIRIWGNKTLYRKATALDRVNVRMLLIVIEPAIKEFLDDFLFELNDQITRDLVTVGLDSYMKNIQSRRGVYTYKIVCDDTNNSAEDIDNYIMNVWVFIQPTKSVEYIFGKIVITKTGSSFSITV